MTNSVWGTTCFLLKVETRGDWQGDSITLSLVVGYHNGQEDAFRSPGWHDEEGLDGLQLRHMGASHRYDSGRVEPRHMYDGQWDCEYHDMYSLGLYDLERMVKRMRSIQRYLDKQAIRPESFAQYAVMVGQAIGAKGILEQKPHGERFANGQRYRWWSLRDANIPIHSAIAAWLEPQSQEVTS